MSDMQDPLERAYYAMLDAAVAMGKAEQAYAQALSEETYEYIVQVKLADQWQFYIGESISPTDKPGLATGFSKVEYAREFAKIETKRPTRIVRRRVSPPEVIND